MEKKGIPSPGRIIGHREPEHRHEISGMSGKKIFWVTMLNAAITITEIVGGLLSGSLALLSDAVHNLSDTAAIALSYIAYKIGQKPKDAKKTYGYKRAEILTAFINATVLMVLSAVLIYEAFQRIRTPGDINSTLMISIGLLGLAANTISVFLLAKDSRKNLNIKSSYLHLLSDAVSSVGVVAGGIAIKLWGFIWIDPLITVLISLYIIKATWQVIKTAVNVLMQSSADLDYEAIKLDIESFETVHDIHHIHSWMIDEKTIFFEAHIDIEDMQLSEVDLIFDRIEQLLKVKYGISHVTLQGEVDRGCNKNMFKI